ncbi:MAG: hypothetical protein JWQ69_2703 [Pseudomonas sp.]|nr:hypothetical protein [Pseudomonas sp.]
MFKTFALALPLACLFGCGQPLVHPYKSTANLQEREHAMLIGKWYGEATTLDGKHMQQISEHRANGTFTVSFRETDKSGQVLEHKEVGVWGVSGKIYFTITTAQIEGDRIRPFKPGNANLNDAYEIIELTATTFRDKSQDNGDDFTETRVDDAFQLSALLAAKP